MTRYCFARRLARLACMACVAAPVAAFAKGAAAPSESSTITITGTRQPDEQLATSEGVDAAELRQSVAVFNAEDSLRYLPGLMVRKRHIGDTQAPLATRTAGVGSSARSLIYADGILLSALIGNNNNTASPRWGMVAPEEIERVDVLYGPFAARYPGNSIGAVVNITTKTPDEPEVSLTAATSIQGFGQYGTHQAYPAYQFAAAAGGRIGRLGIFVSANRLTSRGQPLAYVAVARPTAMSSVGTPVTGAYPDVNRTGAPIYILGAGGLEDQRHHNLKLKLSLDPSPSLNLVYLGGLFRNDTRADAETYLGDRIYAGTVNLDGHLVVIPASAFSNNVYRLDEHHWMHGVTAAGQTGGLKWRASGSLYDFAKDVQRIPSTALPAARDGGAGSIIKLDGTGWRTLDFSAERSGLAFGAHWDRVMLANRRFATIDWLRGDDGAMVQSARGRTTTIALWAQQAIAASPALRLTLGSRYEWWRANHGFNFSASPALSVFQPELVRSGFSPKASLRWQPAEGWRATLSVGQAYRFPTVQELYQAISTGPTITVPNPDLRPERARSAELAIERNGSWGRLRLSLFSEAMRDALLPQAAPLVPGSSALFNHVQNIRANRTHGLELVFERRGALLRRLDLAGSLTLVDPTIVRDDQFPAADGKDIPQVPRGRGNLVVTWHQSDAVSLAVAGRYASRSFGTIDNSDRIADTFQGFQGYLLVDSRLSFRVGKRWEAAVGVENIGNRKYYVFHPFPQRTVTGEVHLRL